MPEVGSYGLRILGPNLLELTLINSKSPSPARVTQWDFVDDSLNPHLPGAQEFVVSVDGQTVPVQTVGFKRRVLYAPIKVRDLRIGNYLYLQISGSIAEGQNVAVTNPSGSLWGSAMTFSAKADPLRFNPAIHVNQAGYGPALSKTAMVGYYLGSLGEMPIPPNSGFKIVEIQSNQPVYQGQLVQRRDVGFTYTPAPYQQVWEADFSDFRTPGEYRLVIPGLGASYPFVIDEGVAAAFARAFAMGLYHQRCGGANELPFTRHTHDACHTAPADVPTMAFAQVQQFLSNMSSDYRNEPRHTAPQLKDVNSSLYPFQNQGKIDVSGGHHDAGDYSKYTINSAGLIHHLVFAADAFPGVGDLDNMGIPESGDGKSDILQEAKWEADFLAKMQDADGGFYFLVYPRDREYEDDALPDKGDPQVVFPKTTAVTAAATAALAEAGSSPLFRKQFPEAADLYLQKAKAGWAFLQRAIAAHGKDGAYQKITHYGNEFMHDDELAWAAAALFVATGDQSYHQQLKSWFNVGDPSTWRWGWWRLFEGYGCAARTYAFAVRSGRLQASQMDAGYLARCEAEIIAAANDQLRFSQNTSYGTSFSDPAKDQIASGWYFSSERAFDMTVGYQINNDSHYLDAIVGNWNYEGGCNPVNVTYVTGLGWKRQRDIVDQYAENDRRVLPPTGIPLGNIQTGFATPLYFYPGQELPSLNFPSDGASRNPYPLYDRWGDSFNTLGEFVVVDLARSLANTAFMMAQSSLKTQAWKSASGQITGLPATIPAEQNVSAMLSVPGIDLTHARIVWEARDQEPAEGLAFQFSPKLPGDQWVEVEAQLPDGRRIFVATNFTASISLNIPPNSFQNAEVAAGSDTVALYHLNGDTSDATGHNGSLVLAGNAKIESDNVGWMQNRSGAALAFSDLGDTATIGIPGSFLAGSPVTVEAMIYINAYKGYNRTGVSLVGLTDNWNASLQLAEDPYAGPMIRGGAEFSVPAAMLNAALTVKQWHHLSLTIDKTGYTAKVDGNVVASRSSGELANWSSGGTAALELGNFDGWVDEVVVRGAGAGSSGGTALSTPVIDPDGGVFSTPVAVTIQSASTGATVRYTVDGSTPNADSQPYVQPFTVSATTTIKAKAFKAGASESAIATANVVIQSNGGGVGNPSPGTQVTFVKTDAVTQGSWLSFYGTAGYEIPDDARSLLATVQVSGSSGSIYTWDELTTDTRALQRSLLNVRIASCWYSSSSFTTALSFNDSNTHRLSLYFLDWDRLGRVQKVEILDTANGSVLDSQTVSGFQDGKYLIWDVKGQVTVRVSRVSGPNAVLMGLFLDPSPGGSGNGAASVQAIRAASGGLQLQITGQAGATYRVEASADLKTWGSIGTVTLSGSQSLFTDPQSGFSTMRFYRVVPNQ